MPKHLRFFASLCLIVFSILFQLSPILAQEGGVDDDETLSTNPKDREILVTATVPDFIDPSVPILIDPEDDELIATSLPTFVWTQSTDNVGIDHYEMTLDGNILFDDIPTGDSENSLFVLDYDGTTGYYHLTVKNVISDGSHTWSITAYDAAENFAESVTWTFIIDSKAPTFVITDVGEVEVTISAQDLDSIPDEPIVLTDNSPLLVGTGEANSTVKVTISIGGGRLPGSTSSSGSGATVLETATFTIDGSGNWQVQLGVLPRDKVITFDFIITDKVGNITLLEGVQIIIPTEYIIIPSLPDLTGLPEPIPTIIEQITTIVEKVPTITIEKPEIKEEIIKIVEFIGLREYLQVSPIVVTPGLWLLILSILALLLILLPRLISLVILIIRLGGIPTPNELRMLLMIIGWWPGRSGGIVFETDQQRPLPFAKVLFIGNDRQLAHVRKTVFTNQHGVYPYIELPEGEYKVHVEYKGILFPSHTKRFKHIPWYNYYLSEIFTVSQRQDEQVLMVPVDLVAGDDGQPPKYLPKSWSVRMLLILCFARPLSNLLFLLAVVITILYPTLINILAVSSYVWALVVRYYRYRHPRHLVQVVDSDSKSLENVLIRVSWAQQATEDTRYRFEIGQTGPDGLFRVTKLIRGSYAPAQIKLQMVYLSGHIVEPLPVCHAIDKELLVTSESQISAKIA